MLLLPGLEPFEIAGPAGPIEGRFDLPQPDPLRPPRFLAVFGHPHPQGGGSMKNNVVVHGSRALARLGGFVARFNFRGVGNSAGQYDGGVGELQDFRAVVAAVRERWPKVETLVAAGFSFGAMRALECAAGGEASRLLLVAPPLTLEDATAGSAPPVGRVAVPTALVLAGEDELVRPPTKPELEARFAELRTLEVVAGANHLFSGKTVALAGALTKVMQKLLPPPW
jgi:alpha/beta superfamily hydrolase